MNATYTLGTDEDVVLDLECTRPGFTFTPGDWTAEVALCPVGEVFDDGTAVWASGSLSTVDTKHYATARLGALLTPVAVGRYRALVRATHTDPGYETPLLKALGMVVVEAA